MNQHHFGDGIYIKSVASINSMVTWCLI